VGMAVLGGYLASKKPRYRWAFIGMGIMSSILIITSGYRARNIPEDISEIRAGVSIIQETINPSQPKQARIHIFKVKLHPLRPNNSPPLNVFFKNTGKVKAEIQIFWSSGFAEPTNKVSEEIKREQILYEQLKATIKNDSKHYHEAPPGVGMWITHPSSLLSEDQFQQLQRGKLVLYFLGAIKYRDADGTRYTTYCLSTQGNPKVIFSCRRYIGENIQQLAE